MDIRILNMIMLSVFPFLLGAAMRYATQKLFGSPSLVTAYSIFFIIVWFAVKRGVFFSGRDLSSQELQIYLIMAVFLILGAVAMDLIYRIRKKD